MGKRNNFPIFFSEEQGYKDPDEVTKKKKREANKRYCFH